MGTVPGSETPKEITTCQELVEVLKRCRESAGDTPDLAIEVTFYAVRRPRAVTLVMHLVDRVRQLLRLNTPHE